MSDPMIEKSDMAEWRKKAHRVIGYYAEIAWRKVNIKKDGSKYKKHRPYRLPSICDELVKCLEDDDEVRAKSIFLSYDGLAAVKK